MSLFRLPDAHPSISRATVTALLEDQHPDLAVLPLGQHVEGWDMAMFRLGDTMAVRMPRHSSAVGSMEVEQRWVERLGAHWTFLYPRTLRRGVPDHGYPWHWSVVEWLDGDVAMEVPLTREAAAPLAEALAQIHRPAPADAPYNDEQSVPMTALRDVAEQRISALQQHGHPRGLAFAADAARAMWEASADASKPAERVWSHADLHGMNVISDAGRFAGIIDWADMAGCDRAVDLSFLYTLMPREAVESTFEHYRRVTGVDDPALDVRARGRAVVTSAGLALGSTEPVRAMGWRGLEALGLVSYGR